MYVPAAARAVKIPGNGLLVDVTTAEVNVPMIVLVESLITEPDGMTKEPPGVGLKVIVVVPFVVAVYVVFVCTNFEFSEHIINTSGTNPLPSFENTEGNK